jgi:hypothetical protein
LLAAASREEPEAAPHAPETLEDLTQSIAGLVDSAAAAETWDRWRRGDAAVVSRRLYTEAGQQAFDEIRRRYRSDPQFRETVTRYVQEFERLLAKVGQNDRDGSQWRAYLKGLSSPLLWGRIRAGVAADLERLTNRKSPHVRERPLAPLCGERG